MKLHIETVDKYLKSNEDIAFLILIQPQNMLMLHVFYKKHIYKKLTCRIFKN